MNFAHRATPRLFRQIALGAALSLAFASSGWAMSFFSPVVQSKKGEPLLAEIDLNDITIQEQIELRAGMASADIYKVTQVEYPNINGTPLDINVELMRRDGGRYYLKLSSDKSISNNFVDLLIELRWSTGRLIKKFSIALSDTKAESKSESKASMPVIGSGSDKLVVERGDTASEIAVTKLEGGVSLDQMLLAMLRSNPDAFVESNVNRMKAGALLTLPTAQEAKAVSSSYGGDIQLRISKGYPFLKNDETLTKETWTLFEDVFGAEKVHELALRMTAEDFAFYSQEIPVCFFRLGVGNASKGITYAVHHPRFDVDIESLKIGIQAMTSIALKG